MDNSVDLQLLLDSGRNPPSVRVISKTVSDRERLNAILDSAYEYAVRKGIQSEIKNINLIVKRNERNLDAMFNFAPLMIQGKVVPPVITEVHDIVQIPNNSTLKTTSVLYTISKQAYFSNLPPNWRTYLTFPETKFTVQFEDTPSKEFTPKGSKEYQEWEKQTIKGFNAGVKQAQEIFRYSLNKLNRDYIGMSRFHEFVIQGKVSMPSISSTGLALANNRSTMLVDQRMLSIRTLPAFEGNMIKWTTWLAPVQFDPSKQSSTINDQ